MPAAVLHDVLAAAVRRLRDAGLDAGDASADVDVLARHVLGWTRARLLAHRRDPAPPAFVERLAALVERRVDRLPVAYLTGTREFYGLDLEVTPDVLIPRPETELAVDAALAALPPAGSGARVVDVGTGSGCIAIAIAVTRPDARIVALDRSKPALAVARRNARRHGVGDRVALVAGDLLSAAVGASGGGRRGVESALHPRAQPGRRRRRRPPRTGGGALRRPGRPGHHRAADRRRGPGAASRRSPGPGDRHRAGRRGRRRGADTRLGVRLVPGRSGRASPASRCSAEASTPAGRRGRAQAGPASAAGGGRSASR